MSDDLKFCWLCTGDKGWGKSYHLSEIGAELLARDPRKRMLVADVAHQWPHGVLRGRIRYALVSNVDAEKPHPEKIASAARLLAKHRCVVVRPNLPLPEAWRPTLGLVDSLAMVAAQHDGPVILVLPEVHLVARNQMPMPGRLAWVFTDARTRRVQFLCDSQHPKRVHTEIRDECIWFVHRTRSSRDHDAIGEAIKAALGRDRVQEALAAVRSLDTLPVGHSIKIDGAHSDLTPRR